jgi:hypothetical protein
MPRKRIIYNTLGAASNRGTIAGVQSMNYDFNLPYQNVTEYGNLGVKNQIVNGQPNINLNLQYLLNNIDNEFKIGLSTGNGTLSGILNDNFSLNFTGFIGKEGIDLSGNIEGLLLFKSGYLTNYAVRGGVGELATVQAQFVCNDLNFNTNTAGFSYEQIIPTGFSQPQTCENNSLSLNLTGLGMSTGDFKIQNFDLSLNINRQPEVFFGENLARYMYITYPIEINMNSEVILGDIEMDTVNQMASGLTSINIILTTPLKKYEIGNCKLVSENFNSSIGPNKTAALSFKSVVGGVNDNLNYFRINPV